jgi:GTP-binding protein YchF
MSLSIGIVGLPNAGKSTLFTALTRAAVEIASYPFTTIAPHQGVVPVPDPRLDAVAGVTHPTRVVPATITVVDIAGLVRGAHRGEGLGNQFLAHIREVDAIAHVVRGFAAPEVPHLEGNLNVLRDVEIVETELALADLATVEREVERARGRAKANDPHDAETVALLEHLADRLKRGISARRLPDDPALASVIHPLRLLTAKPVLYVVNVSDADIIGEGAADALRSAPERKGDSVIVLSAQLEAEAAALPADEAGQILSAFGLEESGLHRFIRSAYELLKLVTFFTTVSREVRAWPIPEGTRAPQAAGRIHSEMENGFIRAEVVGWQDLVRAGAMQRARDQGLIRVEGKEYVVRDGDVMFFRFAP